MTRIAFVNPPEIPGYRSDRDKAGNLGIAAQIDRSLAARWGDWRRRAFPATSTTPLDLLYAVTQAQDLGHTVTLIECLADRLGSAQALARLAEIQPEVIGVRLSIPSLDRDLAFVAQAKAQHPQAKVFVFGMVVMTTYALWAGTCKADYICFGEIEALLPSLLEGKAHTSLGIPGLPQPPIWATVRDLDTLPFPRWDHSPIAAECARISRAKGQPSPFVFQILTSRGCPRGCTMCPYTTNQGSAWRYRSTEHVIAELRLLKERYNARYIQTRDPNIGWKRSRVKELFAAIAAADLDMEFIIETDLEVLDEEAIAIIASAGVTMLYTGVESGDPENLKNIGQSPNAMRIIERNIDLCHKYGVKVLAFWLIGFPTDGWGSIMRSTRYATLLPVEGHYLSVMTPYFGTPMREEVEPLGLIKPDPSWLEYNARTCIQRTNHLGFDDITLAFNYMQGELDLAQRAYRYRRHRGALGRAARYVLLSYMTLQQIPRRLAVRRRAGDWSGGTPQTAGA